MLTIVIILRVCSELNDDNFFDRHHLAFNTHIFMLLVFLNRNIFFLKNRILLLQEQTHIIIRSIKEKKFNIDAKTSLKLSKLVFILYT